MAMGRNRTIRTEVHGNVSIASLSDVAWRVFFGLYPLVDDEGRTPADPAFIAGQIFWAAPRAIDEINAALATLAERALIHRYAIDGVRYLQIAGWRDEESATYQRIEKPQPAKFPGPDSRKHSRNGSRNDSPNTSERVDEPHRNVSGINPGTIPGGSGVDRKGKESSRHEAARSLAEQAVAVINRLSGARYRPDSNPTIEACRKLLADRHTCEQILAAIEHEGKPWVGHAELHGKIRPATLLQLKRVRRAIEDMEARTANVVRLPIDDSPRAIRFDDPAWEAS